MVAGRQLPCRRTDLLDGQSAAARRSRAGARQASSAGPLGHDTGFELPLRAPQSSDHAARPRHDLHHRAGSRRTIFSGCCVARGHLLRGLSQYHSRRGRMKRLFTQFSFPCGIPSHVAPETPGSIHEGGELGYALSHAYGAAFDNPDLIVACIVGDGEAETGSLATSWHSNKFLNPAGDGAVLPILHLNGYKIANPTVLARIPHDELDSLMAGYGHRAIWVEGDDPATVHARMAGALDEALDAIAAIQRAAREGGRGRSRPGWPMIVLRTPKGWTGPKEVDGKPTEGTWRSHQVPLAAMRERPDHVALLETWMRSYRPEELFDDDGRPRDDILAPAPEGTRRMSASPHADGGGLLRPLTLPDMRDQ